MVHAALLLLMLEAAITDLVFTISLKRSTQNLQLSTSYRPITPSIGVTADIVWHAAARTRKGWGGRFERMSNRFWVTLNGSV